MKTTNDKEKDAAEEEDAAASAEDSSSSGSDSGGSSSGTSGSNSSKKREAPPRDLRSQSAKDRAKVAGAIVQLTAAIPLLAAPPPPPPTPAPEGDVKARLDKLEGMLENILAKLTTPP